MSEKNFWNIMNKGIKVNNNYDSNRVSSTKENRSAETNNHKFKEDIGGVSANYKTK